MDGNPAAPARNGAGAAWAAWKEVQTKRLTARFEVGRTGTGRVGQGFGSGDLGWGVSTAFLGWKEQTSEFALQMEVLLCKS